MLGDRLKEYTKYRKALRKLEKIIVNELKENKDISGFKISCNYYGLEFDESHPNIIRIDIEYSDNEGNVNAHSHYYIKYNKKTRTWKKTRKF